MGKVLIIKNNNSVQEIHERAKESYQNKVKRYYNSGKSISNRQAIGDIKTKFGRKGIVLMITYDNSEFKDIKDIFIGDEVRINDQNNIEYIMKIHLNESEHKRVIESIVDKIDLDIDADFESGCYVIMNDMESLYEELRERIISKENVVEYDTVEKEKQPEESYELNVLAQKDVNAVRVYANGDIGECRTEFQRDRERIVNCKAFRRMVDKAQIFSSEKGDYYRTRMTHSLEVNQIAKAIAYALGLNLDLTEAIALGHDLGHTPFGHQGERTLDDILSGEIDVGIKATDKMFEKRCYGGFKHNYQSAKILAKTEEKYKEFPGLNVSVQVIEGVLKHTRLKPDIINLEDFLPAQYLEKICIGSGELQVCSSLEGQVVAIADEIAQRGHDVDDALISGVVTIEEFRDRLRINKCEELFEKINREIEDIERTNRLIVDKKDLIISRIVSGIIDYFIHKTIEYSRNIVRENEQLGGVSFGNETQMIKFPLDAARVNNYLEKVVQKKVICNSEIARADYNASMIIQKLFEQYYKNPRLLHSGTIHKIFLETLKHKNEEVANGAVCLNDGSIKLINKEIEDITSKDLDEALILDYIENGNNSQTEKDIIIFEKRKILIRAITDYIAGMTDGYALGEYEKLK